MLTNHLDQAIQSQAEALAHEKRKALADVLFKYTKHSHSSDVTISLERFLDAFEREWVRNESYRLATQASAAIMKMALPAEPGPVVEPAPAAEGG